MREGEGGHSERAAISEEPVDLEASPTDTLLKYLTIY